jgi:hypothetical protein
VSGHHPEHIGLQKHSVGDIYPLAVVGYGTADEVEYCVEDLCRGTIAAFNNGRENLRRSWVRASDAHLFAQRVQRGEFRDAEHPLIWVPFREAKAQLVSDDIDALFSAEELSAVMQVSAPEHGTVTPVPPPAGRWNWYGQAG